MHRFALVVGVCMLVGPTAAAQTARRISLDTLEARAVRDSNDAVMQYELAMEYWRRKRFDEADTTLRLAVSLAPQYADVYLALATLPVARGDGYWKRQTREKGRGALDSAMMEAGRLFRRAYLLNPLVELRLLGKAESAPQMVFQSGQFIIRVTPWWDREFVTAVNEFRAARYDRAFERFQKLFADDRAGADGASLGDGVLWHRGLTAAHLGKFEVAIRDFEILTGRAVASERETTSGTPMRANDHRYFLATMYLLGGRPDAALQTFRRSLEFDIGLYQAHMQIARIHEARGEWNEAIDAWTNAIAVNSDDPGLLVELGASFARAGRLPEAVEQLSLAVDRHPRDARASYLLGVIALQLGRRDDASTAFQQFLKVAPSRFETQIVEARTHLENLP